MDERFLIERMEGMERGVGEVNFGGRGEKCCSVCGG